MLEINPQPTALSDRVDASWRLPASAGVERLAALLQASPDTTATGLLLPQD